MGCTKMEMLLGVWFNHGMYQNGNAARCLRIDRSSEIFGMETTQGTTKTCSGEKKIKQNRTHWEGTRTNHDRKINVQRLSNLLSKVNVDCIVDDESSAIDVEFVTRVGKDVVCSPKLPWQWSKTEDIKKLMSLSFLKRILWLRNHGSGREEPLPLL